MKIKFDFFKTDEKDKLKLKKIDSKDILYIEIIENSLFFKFVKYVFLILFLPKTNTSKEFLNSFEKSSSSFSKVVPFS